MSILKRLSYVNPKDITYKRIYKAVKRRVKNIPQRLLWDYSLTERIRDNKQRIAHYKDIHKGKRCVIIANGPSLKHIDFDLLKNEYTIGMNRIYLLEKQKGFVPTYLAVSDVQVQLEQFKEEYASVKVPKFYSWFGRLLFDRNDKSLHYFFQHFKNDFSADFRKTIGNSKSVTYVCMQLAYYMGFTEVVLIGKDHSYNITGKAGEKVLANGGESNHFIAGYYNEGQIWKVPNYEEEEYTYKLARKAFEKDGRRIVDATVNGKLDVFEKVDFYEIFPKPLQNIR
jgi:hypothetical protein